MTWCPHCAQNSETHRDYTTGSVCCVDCGKVVSQDLYQEEATFVKDAAGGAHLAGNYVKTASGCSESHIRTLNKGNDVIHELINKYGISNVGHATNYYKVSVERGFTRGRRTGQVAAACLYVACREMDRPFLLIEFSSELGVSVYELGTVYLQLCKLLSLQDHSFVQNPVDPSLFMHRYTSGLMKDGNSKKVLNTALHLAVSMKRDWIQTGRKPSGICAAAIYVSSVLHGYNFSKADVVKAVHICEATLTKRLIEFENTEAGSLTIEEFTQNALDYENEMHSCKQSTNDIKMPGMTEVVCKHNSKAVQSGFGLCKDCYLEFSGGLYGSEPPAFQRAEMERLAIEPVKSLTKSTSQKTIHNENVSMTTIPLFFFVSTAGKLDKSTENVDACESPKEPVDETDTLSDIDDSEVICYLHDEEESRLKKIIWEHMNVEYMQEEAAKEAAAAAARKLYTGTSEEIREAQALAAKAAAAVASRKAEHKRKRELEAKNAKPAQTAAEAAGQHFKKKLSSKINYDKLNDLFGDDEVSSDMLLSYRTNLSDNGQTGRFGFLRVDDVSNVNGKEIANGDDETENREWNYHNEQQRTRYVDELYDQEY
ncbi:hypothetical protein SSX86_009683 [Deinandra increscens subsp. villosa]|uniref:B-related factor 1 n=1 Tax=Deinandra increscens subsp. villosa TaxID=3103831 RepID=A0AAP0H5Y2_9ASTR